MAELKEALDFFDGLGLDDGTGDEAIEAGIGGKGDAVDGANENAGGVDEFLEEMLNFGRLGRSTEGGWSRGHLGRYGGYGVDGGCHPWLRSSFAWRPVPV
jgi:hypothetical protein